MQLEVTQFYYNKLKKYAVVIPLISIDDSFHILFEKRSKLVNQPGDISFPGGFLEEGENFKQAALRELSEELLVKDSDVGKLSLVSTRMDGMRIINAYSAILNVDIKDIQFNEEVESILTIPLKFFKENKPRCYRGQFKMILPSDFPYDLIVKGKNYPFTIPKKEILFYDTKPSIWGVTAYMLNEFIETRGYLYE